VSAKEKNVLPWVSRVRRVRPDESQEVNASQHGDLFPNTALVDERALYRIAALDNANMLFLKPGILELYGKCESAIKLRGPSCNQLCH
jgi:hypothetical protein